MPPLPPRHSALTAPADRALGCAEQLTQQSARVVRVLARCFPPPTARVSLDDPGGVARGQSLTPARRQRPPYLSYQGLLDHLATLARNELHFAGTPAAVPVLTDPTSRQKEAFELIGAAIPLTLRK